MISDSHTNPSLFGPRPNASLDGLIELNSHYRFAGRFTLREPLGRGGFGQVWRVWDLLLEQEVALKISSYNLIVETRSLRRLPKDRYVSIFDYVSDNNVDAHAYSMEVLEPPWMTLDNYQKEHLEKHLVSAGKNLTPRLDAFRMILCTIIDVLRSLAVLHGKKYGKSDRWVHADIKPQNIYINCKAAQSEMAHELNAVRAFTKIGDLGLTCQAGEPPKGATPNYVAPEVEKGRAATPATDLFAVGQTMAFLFLGQPFNKQALEHVNRMEMLLAERIPSDYVVRLVAKAIRKMTLSTPAMRGTTEKLIQMLTEVTGSQKEWKILSVFLLHQQEGLTLKEAAPRCFKSLRYINGWENSSASRLTEVKELIKSMCERGILSRIDQSHKYSVKSYPS